MTNPVISQSGAAAGQRDRILDAAERLLGRFGYRKMTVGDIAAEAGIGKGTVYLSFPSKEEVVLSTVDRIVDRVCTAMEQAAARDASAPDRLRAMLRARVLVRFEAVAAYSASLNDLLGSIRAALLARRVQHFEQEIGVLARVIAGAQRDGELTAGAPRRIARALVLATNSFLPYALSPDELGDAKRLRKEAGDVIDIVVAGITASTPASTPAPTSSRTARRKRP
ncbi:MAG TPA: TetR/AcrR family transcriptional regulator [Thermoanaerobaculia bacterium]|jgi:AcrR family transcriptional regulator